MAVFGISQHKILVKKRRRFLNEGFHILRIHLLQLTVGFFSLFQSAMKLIHPTANFL